MLQTLEWLSRYGLIDIFFGIIGLGILNRLIRKLIPRNYENLHISVTQGGPVEIPGLSLDHSLSIAMRNSGCANFHITRAYFRPKIRRWWCLWIIRIPTRLQIPPTADRISNKDAFEIKFPDRNQEVFSEYETLIRPGYDQVQSTWVPLMQQAQQRVHRERI